MGVMLQAFYWDCPRKDDKEFQWWDHVCSRVPSLADVGFTALWLPPVHKAANLNGPSMGYDPYDYYDLGEFDQKGTIPTWFGTWSQLMDLIRTAHGHGLSMIADVVINHNSGAVAQEVNPITGQSRSGTAAAQHEHEDDADDDPLDLRALFLILAALGSLFRLVLFHVLGHGSPGSFS